MENIITPNMTIKDYPIEFRENLFRDITAFMERVPDWSQHVGKQILVNEHLLFVVLKDHYGIVWREGKDDAKTVAFETNKDLREQLGLVHKDEKISSK